MRTRTNSIAAAQLLLILPAAVFMAALVVRDFGPLQSPPASTAQQIVMLYANRTWTLWSLLVTLPLAVLLIGSVTLLTGQSGDDRPRAEDAPAIATRVIAASTLAAAAFLTVVVAHMLAN